MPAAKKSFLNPTAASLIIYFITVVVSTFAIIIVPRQTQNFLMLPITIIAIKVLLFFFIPFLLRNHAATMRKLEWIAGIVFTAFIVNFLVSGTLSSLASPFIEELDIFTLGMANAEKYTGLSYWVYVLIKLHQGFFLLHFWVAFNSPLPFPRLRYCLKGEQ